MAANYWASTQRRHWQFTKDQLSDVRERLEDSDRGLVQQYPLPDRRLLSIYFNQRMSTVSFLTGQTSSCALLLWLSVEMGYIVIKAVDQSILLLSSI